MYYPFIGFLLGVIGFSFWELSQPLEEELPELF